MARGLVNVRRTVDTLTPRLSSLQREQLPFAIASSLTATARGVVEDLRRDMVGAFQSPVRYTLQGVAFLSASKARPTATVLIKDRAAGTAPASYLTPGIKGGGRNAKGAEVALRARGLIGSDDYLVPAVAARRDASGNVGRAQIRAMLAGLGTLYTVDTIDGVRAVWVRRARKVRPFMLIVKAPQYSARFDFFALAERHALARFPVEFDAALRRALASAR